MADGRGGVGAAEMAGIPRRAGLEAFEVIADAQLAADHNAVGRSTSDRHDLAGSQPKDVLPFVAVAHDQIGRPRGAIGERNGRFGSTRHDYDC